MQELIERAVDLVKQADGLLVTAGAGMGIDSGLPDFRGKRGFWNAYPALGQSQIGFEDIASPSAFQKTPHRAWGFYGHRLVLYRETVPHIGFQLLKKWGETMEHGSAVFTSNVDGQFQKAGFNHELINECHGSIHHFQCLECCNNHVWEANNFFPKINIDTCELVSELPKCMFCGKLARPNIYLFSDWSWNQTRQFSQETRLKQWLAKCNRPIVIEVGAGSTIPTVRNFSRQMLYKNPNARLIRINPIEYTIPTDEDVGLPMGAVAALTAMSKIY